MFILLPWNVIFWSVFQILEMFLSLEEPEKESGATLVGRDSWSSAQSRVMSGVAQAAQGIVLSHFLISPGMDNFTSLVLVFAQVP